jgi:hypothetical protein
MIRYNFTYLNKRLTPEEIVTYLACKTKQFQVKDPQLKYRNLMIWHMEREHSQSGYILKPELLFKNEIKAEVSEIYRYIQLASLRSYVSYIESGQSYVLLSIIEDDLNIDKLKFNRLLTITNNKVCFMYE